MHAATTGGKNRRILRNLLQTYKSLPLLWDKKHKQYFNKKARYEAFKDLLKIYQEIDCHATIITVRKKIDNFRNTYMRELKKVKTSQLTAKEPEDVYEPTVWHYKELGFLEHLVRLDTTRGSRAEHTDTESERSVEEDQSNNTIKEEDQNPLDSDWNEHYAVESNDDIDNGIQETGEKIYISYAQPMPRKSSKAKTKKKLVTNRKMSLPMGPDEIIGHSFGVQLAGLQVKQKAIALKLISDAIYYASLGKLQETSTVQL
ncbi:uncharacterized protein LOC114351588 [Ostrinia furnacalis]|uniref:uncharacterized protein LOC114351588 n=1 Tax=Ostrinia furnacalis TaxID=93504 RepID=UPI00103CE524|nr:uncharacterized protein LOC114351588 [Ostrinia furnacalis]